MTQPADPSLSDGPCQRCGACCGYSADWPRFTIEDDAALDAIPAELVNARQAGMRCDGNRCAALAGEIGVATACTIHPLRPQVCRDCEPGDAECLLARRKFGLPALPADAARSDQLAGARDIAVSGSGSSRSRS